MKDLGRYGEAEQQQTFKRCLLYDLDWQGTKHYYTDYDVDMVWGGTTYTAKAIQSGNIETNKAVSVSISADEAYLQQMFLVTPSGQCTLKIYRANLYFTPEGGEPQDVHQVFQGNLATTSLKGGVANVTFAVGSMAGGQIPRCLCTKQCNWQIFDENCKLNRANFTVSAQVIGLDLNLRGVVVNVDKPEKWFNKGTLTINGQPVQVDKSFVNANGGHTLIVGTWPTTVNIGDLCTIVPGCDGWGTTCRGKYSNGANFGGFEALPFVNYTLFGP